MDSGRNILVIGGGPAGTYAAIAAKKQDPAAHVVLLSDEPDEPYEKPPLSKGVLLGTVKASDAPIAGPGGVAAYGVTFEQGVRCLSIDRANQRVVLEGDRTLPYDALVIATGAAARQVPLLPASMPGIHYLRSRTDADALKAALGVSRHLVVVGGGLIGLEVAASAAERGLRVTVLEVAPRIMARVCYEDIASLVHAAHVQHGVDIRVNTTVTAAEPQPGGGLRLTTATGEILEADVVVVGTGASPDARLAAGAGLQVDDGLIVDEYCRTSDPQIFAAGDVARFPGPGCAVRLENWRHALDQGTVAGRNAAGATEVYAPLPSFWSEQYDLYIQGVGWAVDRGQRVERRANGTHALTFVVDDSRVVYVLGINAQRDMAAVRRLIERRVPVDVAALANPAQPLQNLLKRQ